MPKRKIVAREFVADLRSDMDDPALMRKYKLSHNQLEKILEKLVEADFITVVELEERSKLSESQITRAYVDAQKAIDELD